MTFIKQLHISSIEQQGGREWGCAFPSYNFCTLPPSCTYIFALKQMSEIVTILLCYEREVLHNLVHVYLV